MAQRDLKLMMSFSHSSVSSSQLPSLELTYLIVRTCFTLRIKKHRGISILKKEFIVTQLPQSSCYYVKGYEMWIMQIRSKLLCEVFICFSSCHSSIKLFRFIFYQCLRFANLSDSVAETQSLSTGAKQKGGDRVLDEIKINSFIVCQAKGATVGCCLQDCVSRPGGGGGESYSIQGAGRDQLVDILLIGWW